MLLKLAATVLLIVFVLRHVDLGTATRALAETGLVGAVLGVGLTALAIVIGAIRWRRVLAHLGERVALAPLLGDVLVGATYNLLLPTGVGGDVIRALRCAERVEHADRAWASVAFERVLGLLALVLVSALGLLLRGSEATRRLLWVAVGLTMFLVLALTFADGPLRLMARLARRAPGSLSGTIERIAAAFSGPLARPAPRLETFGWSLLYQVVALSILVAAGSRWHDPALLSAVFVGVPIALVASLIPVTIGGFGLRESLFVVVLGPFGIAPERALALSVVWLLANVAVGVAGLAVMLGERR